MPIKNVEGFENCICHHSELVNMYECSIGEGTKIGSFVEIGRNVKIGRNCKIETGAFIPEGVIIGGNVFIGPHAVFCNCKHPMQGEPYQQTIVKDNAIIGANATILPGIKIGSGAVVGAGAIVTKNVQKNQVVMGVAAK